MSSSRARVCLSSARVLEGFVIEHLLFVVYAGTERYPVAESVEVIGLAEMPKVVTRTMQWRVMPPA